MKLSEKLQDLHDCGDVGLYVEGFADEARLIENAVDALTDENRRLDLCLASKTDIANQLKDNLADAFMREIDIKHKHNDVLDKYLKLKFQVDKMLIQGDWYAGAVEGNPHIDFEEVRRQIIEII